MQAYGKDFPGPEFNGQFDKLTDRTEGTPGPEFAEGALSKPYIYTVAHASGSERCAFIPWLMLLLILHSVSLLLSFPCNSVFVHGYASSWLSFRD